MLDTDLLRFQCDLRDGYTIEEALTRNKLSFKYVMDNLPRAYCSKSKNRGRKKEQ